jgi:hypothetical protein
LTSPTFDLSGASDASVSFALWFYVRDGREGDDKFVVEIGDGTNWHATPLLTIAADEDCPPEENCLGHHLVDNPAFAKVRWERQRCKIPLNALGANRKLRFTALKAAQSSGVIEAAIDEIRVWGVYD